MTNHPLAALRRRPLLTPMWLSGVGALVFAVVLAYLWNTTAMTTVFVVRHAEKAMDGTRDPPLSDAGMAHAQRLAALFAKGRAAISLSAVYATEFRRTRQTAEAVAARLQLPVVVRPAGNVAAVVEDIKSHHRGRSVLVVGHSNTVPEVVQALGGKAVPPIADDEYSRLYVVSVGLFSRTTVTELSLP